MEILCQDVRRYQTIPDEERFNRIFNTALHILEEDYEARAQSQIQEAYVITAAEVSDLEMMLSELDLALDWQADKPDDEVAHAWAAAMWQALEQQIVARRLERKVSPPDDATAERDGLTPQPTELETLAKPKALPDSGAASDVFEAEARAVEESIARGTATPLHISSVVSGRPMLSPDESKTAGMSSTKDVPFDGEHVPGYQAIPVIGPLLSTKHTEKDREKMLDALKERTKKNRKTAAQFLGNYVQATIDIWGRYVTSEMRDAALASGSGTATKLLRFVATESLAILAGGGAGRILAPVWGKVAGKVVGKLSNKVTDFTGGLVSDEWEKALLADDMKKRKDALDKVNASVASSTGEFVQASVESLDDDLVDRTAWLMKAPLSDLRLFRIPEKLPPVDKSIIRSVVAGVIASKVHKHDADKPCDSIGLQCGIAEIVPKGSVGELDDNVIKIGLRSGGREPSVKYIRFFSASPVLARELAKKAKVGMLPKMAMRIEVDRGDPTMAAGAIIAAAGIADQSNPEDEDKFAKRYGELLKGYDKDAPPKKDITLMTRNPEAGLRIAGLGLAEALWLYELASGDSSHDELATNIENRHLYEQEHVVSDSNEPVSLRPSPVRLAELTHAVVDPHVLKGLEKLIADHLAQLTLPNVEPKGRRVAR